MESILNQENSPLSLTLLFFSNYIIVDINSNNTPTNPIADINIINLKFKIKKNILNCNNNKYVIIPSRLFNIKPALIFLLTEKIVIKTNSIIFIIKKIPTIFNISIFLFLSFFISIYYMNKYFLLDMLNY